jgi:hypothetical protein
VIIGAATKDRVLDLAEAQGSVRRNAAATTHRPDAGLVRLDRTKVLAMEIRVNIPDELAAQDHPNDIDGYFACDLDRLRRPHFPGMGCGIRDITGFA